MKLGLWQLTRARYRGRCKDVSELGMGKEAALMNTGRGGGPWPES